MAGGNVGGAKMPLGVVAAIMVIGAVAWVMNSGGGHRVPSREAQSTHDHAASTVAETPGEQPTTRRVPAGSVEPKPVRNAPHSASASTDLGEVRIGAWNIEWLGKPEDRSGVGRDVAQDPNDLADAIIFSKVAALGVAEVVTRLPGRPVRSREIEAVIDAIERKTGDAWEYVLFPGRADRDQLTGVLWNTRVLAAKTPQGEAWSTTDSTPWMLPIPKQRSEKGSYLWNRPPHAMKFSTGDGRTDFVLVMLHMKADYQGDFASHRRQEAEALVKALPEVRAKFKDSDIILTGDTNCTQQHEAALRVFENAGLTDLNADWKTTHWRGGATDRTIVPADQPEFAGSMFQIGSDAYLKARGMTPQDFKQRYSDHYLIWTTVKVMPDDD